MTLNAGLARLHATASAVGRAGQRWTCGKRLGRSSCGSWPCARLSFGEVAAYVDDVAMVTYRCGLGSLVDGSPLAGDSLTHVVSMGVVDSDTAGGNARALRSLRRT
jgi:hypothetical protein